MLGNKLNKLAPRKSFDILALYKSDYYYYYYKSRKRVLLCENLSGKKCRYRLLKKSAVNRKVLQRRRMRYLRMKVVCTINNINKLSNNFDERPHRRIITPRVANGFLRPRSHALFGLHDYPPNGISIGSAVFTKLTNLTNRPTD